MEILVEAFLASADARERLVEVARTAVGVLQAFVVDDEPFLQVFLERRICPAAKLRATRGSGRESR